MIRVIQWLYGFIKFRYYNGFVEGFVNDIYSAGLNVQNITCRDGVVYAQCSARTYKKLRHIAHKNGGIIRIEHKSGPIFAFLKIQNRWGLFVGALCLVLIINVLSGFVWNINIVGNERIPQSDIMLFLEENGVRVGTFSRSINCDVVENLFMASFDDCAWAHINLKGSTATFEINEVDSKPDVVNQSVVTNVIAKKDGIILKTTTFDGWQVANVGDGVAKGDLLISGIYESDEVKKNLFAHARGEMIAKVDESFEMTISRQQCQKSYTSTRTFKSIFFYGIRIPLYIGSSKIENADVDIDNNYLVLNGREIPIGIVTKTAKLFDLNTVVLNDKDLNAITIDEVNKKIERQLNGCEIISQDVDVSLGATSAVAKVDLLCIEDIGDEVMVKVDKKKYNSKFDKK